MCNFKPQVRVITEESNRDYRNSYKIKSAYVDVVYPTYKELKKNLLRHLQENIEDSVFVNRSRRGEWGEWWEKWQLVGGNPKIINNGWEINLHNPTLLPIFTPNQLKQNNHERKK